MFHAGTMPHPRIRNLTFPQIGRLIGQARNTAWRRGLAGHFGPVNRAPGRPANVAVNEIERRFGAFAAQQIELAVRIPHMQSREEK
jgi:hypothetical protein